MGKGKKSISRSTLYGADDIYLTNKYIAIRKVSISSKDHRLKDRTSYYPKTKENMRVVGNVYGHIRKGR